MSSEKKQIARIPGKTREADVCIRAAAEPDLVNPPLAAQQMQDLQPCRPIMPERRHRRGTTRPDGNRTPPAIHLDREVVHTLPRSGAVSPPG